jgi:hypothetical protein
MDVIAVTSVHLRGNVNRVTFFNFFSIVNRLTSVNLLGNITRVT